MNKKQNYLYKDLPLSGYNLKEQLLHLHEKLNIIDNRTINNANFSVDDLFQGRGYCIIFMENKGQNIGHWTVILRNEHNEACFMDSLAIPVESYNAYLPIIFKDAKYTLFENRIELQGSKSMLCGKYALYFIAMNKLNVSFNDMIKFLLEMKKRYKSVDDYIFVTFAN